MSTQEAREALIDQLLVRWKDSEEPTGKKLWASVTEIMEFVGRYPNFAGADKKKEALAILEVLLDKTDSPGPDFVVDKAILWAADYGIDALYDAFKGKFAFDGQA